jgi:hypothetical protein
LTSRSDSSRPATFEGYAQGIVAGQRLSAGDALARPGAVLCCYANDSSCRLTGKCHQRMPIARASSYAALGGPTLASDAVHRDDRTGAIGAPTTVQEDRATVRVVDDHEEPAHDIFLDTAAQTERGQPGREVDVTESDLLDELTLPVVAPQVHDRPDAQLLRLLEPGRIWLTPPEQGGIDLIEAYDRRPSNRSRVEL